MMVKPDSASSLKCVKADSILESFILGVRQRILTLNPLGVNPWVMQALRKLA